MSQTFMFVKGIILSLDEVIKLVEVKFPDVHKDWMAAVEKRKNEKIDRTELITEILCNEIDEESIGIHSPSPNIHDYYGKHAGTKHEMEILDGMALFSWRACREYGTFILGKLLKEDSSEIFAKNGEISRKVSSRGLKIPEMFGDKKVKIIMVCTGCKYCS